MNFLLRALLLMAVVINCFLSEVYAGDWLAFSGQEASNEGVEQASVNKEKTMADTEKLTLGEAVKVLKSSQFELHANGQLTLQVDDGGWGHTKNQHVRGEAKERAAQLVEGLAQLGGLNAKEDFNISNSGLVVGIGSNKDPKDLSALINRLAELGINASASAVELHHQAYQNPYEGKLQNVWQGEIPASVADEAWVQPTVINLSDYEVPSHEIETTNLTYELNAPDDVIVTGKLKLKKHPESSADASVIRLNAAPESLEEGNEAPTLHVLEVKVDGRKLEEDEYLRVGGELIIPNLPNGGDCEIETKSQIDPQSNKSGVGLYMSGKFTTQCESQGFRNMTPFLDRPDAMSVFTTTIIAPEGEYPQLLANGNKPDALEKTDDGRDKITWNNPEKMPSYLFALVAGDMDILSDKYTTMSGREVDINIYCDKGDREKLHHAMDSIKKAMQWDEEWVGHEYNLDTFNIVAVNDFNFGAMENKGLNIFNASAVLADPKTATDTRYEYVQAVVGHEYFHDLTGDTIVPRDWFQLTLKEGLTVLRDSEFTSDLNSRAVKRIDDVGDMRGRQFTEDAGAMAHPIRPSSFENIENFYTATVYEKGKEVIGMIKTLVGDEAFKEGMRTYKADFSGKNATTEDFVASIAKGAQKHYEAQKAAGVEGVQPPPDLTQFEETWYNQAGTPTLDVTDEYDPKTKEYRLTIKQSVTTHPDNKPYHMPVRVGLLDSNGNDMPLEIDGDPAQLTNGDVLNLREGEQTFVFKNVDEKPLPSLLRNWSAPVKLNYDYSRDDLTFLMSNDSDGFNRWEAAQQIGVQVLQDQVAAIQAGQDLAVDDKLIGAVKAVLADKSLDKALAARTLALPGEDYIASLYPDGQVDPDAIHEARDKTKAAVAKALEAEFKATFDANRSTETRDYEWNVADAGERAIKNTALGYLMSADADKYLPLAVDQVTRDQNATDNQSALSAIAGHGDDQTMDRIFEKYYQDNKENPLIVNMWLARQAMADRPGALDRVKDLVAIGEEERQEIEAKKKADPNFDADKEPRRFNNRNANAIRSLVGAFASNPSFHDKDGSGYEFLADQIIDVAKFNEGVAARLTTIMASPHRLDPERQELMRGQLQRVQKNVSSGQVKEIVGKTLSLLDKKQAEAKKGGKWSSQVVDAEQVEPEVAQAR